MDSSFNRLSRTSLLILIPPIRYRLEISSELIKGVQDVTSTNGYDLIACSSIGGAQSTTIKFLKEKRVDGVIILAHNITDETILESTREGFPIVVFDRDIKHDHVLQVEVDNVEGGFQATEHLIMKGHQNIAYISGPYNSQYNELRFQGFKQSLEKHGITYRSTWKTSGGFTREGGYKATKMLIAQQDIPEAIFYANDEMAIGGLKALSEKNIRVPEYISIIGFDDIQLAEYVPPPLTTMRQRNTKPAHSLHLIFQKLAKEEVDPYYKLTTELVERRSVKDIM
ncbi:MAG: substrate-binding domain-containing protein [Bacillota bacterium]